MICPNCGATVDCDHRQPIEFPPHVKIRGNAQSVEKIGVIPGYIQSKYNRGGCRYRRSKAQGVRLIFVKDS